MPLHAPQSVHRRIRKTRQHSRTDIDRSGSAPVARIHHARGRSLAILVDRDHAVAVGVDVGVGSVGYR